MRTVSLLPAATEIVAALGAVDRLVGVTHECDYPAAVAVRARVTSSAVDGAAPPGVVDAAVRDMALGGAPLFTVHERMIAALRPELILTQALCDVCAVSETDVRALAARLRPLPRVVTLAATTLDGVFGDVLRVAEALGVPEAGERLVAELRGRLRRVHETLKAAAAPRPRVAVIEWTDPVYAAGHWVPEVVRRAGGVDVLASPGQHSRPRDADEVRRADPEVLLVAPCGYDAARAAEEARRLLAREEWAWARDRRVWALDANGLVSRPGPRLVDGAEVMAAIFAPTLFPPPAEAHAVRIRTAPQGAAR
jgi:iron complex transport system substrate-binding protein